MSTTVTYKGNTIATVSNQTKTLKTQGKYMEGDVTLTDVSQAAPNLQAKTNIAPTTSSQTITADSGYDGLSSVQINAMPTGTAGTPTATKGTVSNHAVTVTPSVTNITGYITGETKTGTGVNVSASELVSGTLSITQNGTADVTNYASVDVSVSGSTIPTAYVSEVYTSNILYYTDSNMTVQSGVEIVGQNLPVGTLVFIYNAGPAPYFSQYIGLTKLVGYGSAMKGEYLVYEVTG